MSIGREGIVCDSEDGGIASELITGGRGEAASAGLRVSLGVKR